MNPSKERLVRDLAAQAGLVLRNVRLIEELRASRRRIVTAQDERAKQLERNLHDGAQQQLVALGVQLSLAQPARRTRRPRDGRRRSTRCSRRRPTRSRTSATSRAGSTRRCSPTRVWSSRSRRRRARRRSRSRSRARGSAATRRRSRRPSTSAAWRRSRTSRSTRTRRARTCGSPTGTGRSRSRSPTTGRGSTPSDTPLGTGLQGMKDRLEALGGIAHVDSSPGGGTTVAGRSPPVAGFRPTSIRGSPTVRPNVVA